MGCQHATAPAAPQDRLPRPPPHTTTTNLQIRPARARFCLSGSGIRFRSPGARPKTMHWQNIEKAVWIKSDYDGASFSTAQARAGYSVHAFTIIRSLTTVYDVCEPHSALPKPAMLCSLMRVNCIRSLTMSSTRRYVMFMPVLTEACRLCV
jgi:hypothetical protein